MNVFVTGARGFVGSALVIKLIKEGHKVITASREASQKLDDGVDELVVGDIALIEDWTPYLKGVDVVVHLAGRAHVMDEISVDPIEEYRRNNTWPTSKLFRDSVLVGVKRVVFLSSIKVNGESTLGNECFESDVSDAPSDPYGLSKYEAEVLLHAQAKQSRTEFVILRPPMIYGKGVKGNLVTLIKAVHRGIPLPFGCIENLRSLISLSNLVDILTIVMIHPKAANEVFCVSDGKDISLRSLVENISTILSRSPRIIPIPRRVLVMAFRAIGRKDLVNKLLSNLRLDSSKTKSLLNWQPSADTNAELASCVESVVQRK